MVVKVFPDASRREAVELAAKVDAYREKQEERIEKLNRDYQRTFSRLMDELKDLHGQSLKQQFELEAMNIADQMALKWEEQTQPRKFRDTLQKSVNEQLARMAQAEAALAAARATYAESYRDAVLQLKQLAPIVIDPRQCSPTSAAFG